MVTPFLENGEINVEVLENFTSWLIESGISGLFPCGTTGEGHLLSIEERKLVAETVIRAAESRVLVYIQTGAMSLRDTLDLSRHALSSGADGIGVVTPSYYVLSQDNIRDYYIELAKNLPGDFPVYMYSIPDNALNDIEPSTAAAIAAECPNIIGIKYSDDNFVQLQAYNEIRGGEFSVLAGNDRTFASVMSSGCDGTVSGLSNLFPEKVMAVFKAFQKRDVDEAMKAQREVFLASSPLFDGFFLAGLKAGIGFRGIPVGTLRKPLPELSETEFENLKKHF